MPHLGDLRYQLLTGIAGTVAWAREIGAVRAIFIVHEFVTNRTRDENHARNTADLKTFLHRFSDGAVTQLSVERLAGPIQIPGNAHMPRTVPIYVGKATRRTRLAESL